MSPDVNFLSAERDGTRVVGLEQDAERVQGKLQLGTQPDEDAAHLLESRVTLRIVPEWSTSVLSTNIRLG